MLLIQIWSPMAITSKKNSLHPLLICLRNKNGIESKCYLTFQTQRNLILSSVPVLIILQRTCSLSLNAISQNKEINLSIISLRCCRNKLKNITKIYNCLSMRSWLIPISHWRYSNYRIGRYFVGLSACTIILRLQPRFMRNRLNWDANSLALIKRLNHSIQCQTILFMTSPNSNISSIWWNVKFILRNSGIKVLTDPTKPSRNVMMTIAKLLNPKRLLYLWLNKPKPDTHKSIVLISWSNFHI